MWNAYCPGNIATAEGMRKWVAQGLMLGRPLVLGRGLQWLWGLCFAFLAVYAILALLFRDAADHCIATLHENPGKSLITAILAVLLTPLMFLLLAITVVGLLVIPHLPLSPCSAPPCSARRRSWAGSAIAASAFAPDIPHRILRWPCVVGGAL